MSSLQSITAKPEAVTAELCPITPEIKASMARIDPEEVISHRGITFTNVIDTQRELGRYNADGETITCVDLTGKIYTGPYTAALEARLLLGGFDKSNSLALPLSNEGVPVEPGLAARWEKLLENAKTFNKADYESVMKDLFAAKAAERNISVSETPPGGNWVLIDGATYSYIGSNEVSQCASAFYDNKGQPSFDRLEDIGKFYSNNSMTAAIDARGRCFVHRYEGAEADLKLSRDLLAAGYTARGIFVPFSNGERPESPAMAIALGRKAAGQESFGVL